MRASDGRQIVIGAASIAHIAQTSAECEVRYDLPRIAHIPLGAAIELPTRREAEFRPLGKESLAVAQDDGSHRVVQWILRATRERPGGGGRSERSAGPHLRDNAEELGESAAQNAVEIYAIAQDVGFKLIGAVVFDLLVALESSLRRQQIGTSLQSAGDPDLDAGIRIEDTGVAEHSIANVVLELHVAEANLVSEAASEEIETDEMGRGIVAVHKR